MLQPAGRGLIVGAVLAAALAFPGAATARALPDLTPASVRALGTQVAPGATFRVRDRVRNAGRARSGRFSMTYLLSRDRRRGRDVKLRGSRRVGRLRAGHSSSHTTRVRVPAATAGGRWWVLSCADARRRVRERRERNNCRASAHRIVVAAPSPPAPPAPVASTTPTKPSAPAGTLVAAVGDIACDATDPDYNSGQGTFYRCRQGHVAPLVSGASAFFALGDLQYEEGTAAQFAASYDHSFGPYKSITHPVPGNHEYEDPAGGAAGYFGYFGARAGDPAKGYYSFDIAGWHVIALNSNCTNVSCDAASPQETWLRADLAAHPNKCVAAMWHHPLRSSFTDPTAGNAHTGNEPRVAPLYKALREAGADLILNGHAHNYERFAPMTETGAASPAGVREIVVGTGGEEHHPIQQAGVYSTSEKIESFDFGLLRLRLTPTAYSWAFVNESGHTLDSGSAACH